MAVNVSPDPVTTATASVTEDFLVGCVVALIATHPWLALTLSMTLLAIGIALVVILWRRVRAALARRREQRFRLPGERARSSPLAFPDQAGFAGARGTGGDVTPARSAGS